MKSVIFLIFLVFATISMSFSHETANENSLVFGKRDVHFTNSLGKERHEYEEKRNRRQLDDDEDDAPRKDPDDDDHESQFKTDDENRKRELVFGKRDVHFTNSLGKERHEYEEKRNRRQFDDDEDDAPRKDPTK